MLLIDLKGKLDEIQAERGNVPLSRVHIMHGYTTLIAHAAEELAGADDEGDEPNKADAKGPKLVTIADAEGITGTLEERLQEAGITGIVSLKGEELLQLLECKAELHGMLEDKLNLAPPKRDEAPQLTGEEKAAARKEFEMAQEKLAHTMAAATNKLPTEVADLEGKGKEVRMPCPQFDSNKVGCVLPFGHETDHDFDPTHAPAAERQQGDDPSGGTNSSAPTQQG